MFGRKALQHLCPVLAIVWPATHQPLQATLAASNAECCGNGLVLARVGLQKGQVSRQLQLPLVQWQACHGGPATGCPGEPRICEECCCVAKGPAASWPAAQGKLTRPICARCTWLGSQWPLGSQLQLWANSRQHSSGLAPLMWLQIQRRSQGETHRRRLTCMSNFTTPRGVTCSSRRRLMPALPSHPGLGLSHTCRAAASSGC